MTLFSNHFPEEQFPLIEAYHFGTVIAIILVLTLTEREYRQN
jgi:hypothetical protein